MEIVDLFLKIGGDNNNIVLKSGVTVAEVKVLYELHGGTTNEPIAELQVVDDVDIDARQLKEQLRNRYSAKQEYLDIIERLFPGSNPTMIETVDELGLSDGIPTKRKPGPKAKIKKTVEVDPLG